MMGTTGKMTIYMIYIYILITTDCTCRVWYVKRKPKVWACPTGRRKLPTTERGKNLRIKF